MEDNLKDSLFISTELKDGIVSLCGNGDVDSVFSDFLKFGFIQTDAKNFWVIDSFLRNHNVEEFTLYKVIFAFFVKNGTIEFNNIKYSILMSYQRGKFEGESQLMNILVSSNLMSNETLTKIVSWLETIEKQI